MLLRPSRTTMDGSRVKHRSQQKVNTSSNNHQFIDTVRPFIQNRKFPTEDVCNVFNILVRISPYYEKSGLYASDSLPNSGQVLIGDQDLNQKFLQEIVGRIRHSIYDVPKDQFTLTMSNLIEFQ